MQEARLSAFLTNVLNEEILAGVTTKLGIEKRFKTSMVRKEFFLACINQTCLGRTFLEQILTNCIQNDARQYAKRFFND